MVQLTDNLRGALAMTGSMTAFTVNDAFMKTVGDQLPLFQAIFLRGVFVVIMLVVLARVMGQLRFQFRSLDWWLIGLRTVVEVASAILIVQALWNLPIANVSAILQALPLTVTLAAAVVFKEPLGWRRLTAILVGFVGVMLIVRPGGADFNVFTLYAVGGVVCVTIRDLAARRMAPDVPSTMVALIAAVAVTVMAGVGAQFETWVPMTAQSALPLVGAGVFIVGGYVFSVAAMRSGEIGFVAQFRYSSLLVALVLGVVVFADWPKPLTVLGAAIVVAMGLFTLYRERQLHPAPRNDA